MATPSDIIKRGLRSAQPTPSANAAGVLYYVTDEKLMERWSGSTWESVEGFSGGDGTISALTNKANPTDADYLLIEDAAAADAQKHITIANLFEGSNPDFVRLEEQASDPSTPASGYGALYGKTDGAMYYIGDDGIVRPGGISEGCRVRNSSNLTIANATPTNLTFDTEVFDTNGLHSTSTNTERITIQVAGRYIVFGGVEWDTNGTSWRVAQFQLNGSDVICLKSEDGIASIPTRVVLSTVYDFAASDYITFRVNQNSGGNLDVLSSGLFSPIFGALRIG